MGKTIIGFLILIIIIQCKPKEEQTSINNKTSVIQIKKSFDNKNKWLVEDNKDSLSTIIHPIALYAHSNCWVQNSEDITIGNPKDSLRYLSIDVIDLNVDAVENTGIVQGVAHFKGLYKQDTFDMDLCFVETYARVKGVWQLVGRQSAKVPAE